MCYKLVQCSFVPSLFDNMINSNNNPSNEDAGKACAYITKCVESAAVVRTRKRSKLWFDSECFALKQQVRDQYTVVKSWDSRAARDNLAFLVKDFQRLKTSKIKGRRKNNLVWVRRSSRLKESNARRMHYGACGSLAVRVEVVYLCRRRSGSNECFEIWRENRSWRKCIDLEAEYCG